MPECKGFVYIVGAGPGDYGLITVKGLECIKAADVLIYDRLINGRFISQAKAGCELIYAGKESSRHAIAQDELNGLIADKAAAGNIVTRLKGGDPYIFGRGGEEALHLSERGIPFEVVPGVSAFSAVPAYAGIPVTHRGYASTAAVITGHEDPLKETCDIDWKSLAGIGTLVFFMGVKNLSKICENLIACGMNETAPAALIERGATPFQKTLISDLKNIAAGAAVKKISPPSIFVVGPTVELSRRLNWFESRPLSGRKIIVTRAREQASKLSDRLEKLGAAVYETPMIKFVPPDDDYESLKSAFSSINSYNLIVFTSVNGVSRFFDCAYGAGFDIRDFAGPDIAAIGEKTAAALHERFLKTKIVPDEYKAENLAEKIIETYKSKKLNILIARAQNARDTLVEKLKNAGHEVFLAHVYKSVPAGHSSFDVKELLHRGEIDLVTFASSSTVENFVEAAGTSLIKEKFSDGFVKTAVIGPITAETCLKHGIKPDIQPAEYTIEALVDEILRYYNPAFKVNSR